MKNLRDILYPHSNVEELSFLILRELGVKFIKSTVSKRLFSHPDYPSFSSIKDVFDTFGIDSVALKTSDLNALCTAHEGFLCQIRIEKGQSLFAYVYSLSDTSVDWYNPMRSRRETIGRELFLELFSGYVMFFDSTDKTDEPNYAKHRKKELMFLFTQLFLLLSLPLILSVSLFISWQTVSYTNALSATVTILLLSLGSVIGGLLLLYEYNAYTPVLTRICGMGQRLNCAAILHSSASKILGIPWSVVGMSYFTGVIASLICSLHAPSMLQLAAYIHLLALPVVIFSIYYQHFVVRQWCPLCLGAVLVVLLLLSCYLLSGQYSAFPPVHASDFFTLLLCFFLSFTSFYFLWSLSQLYREKEYYETSFSRLRLNKEVFSALLQKERKIEMPTDDCGIILGNPHGSIHIVKVCNPYCSHCADAQPILQKKVKTNQDVKLQIVFAVDPHTEYYKQTPIDLFLSLYHESADIDTVLADWYSNPGVDMEQFKQKYPVEQSHTKWNTDNAGKMHQFCQETGIIGTPTIFINGHELPANYQISDLTFCI